MAFEEKVKTLKAAGVDQVLELNASKTEDVKFPLLQDFQSLKYLTLADCGFTNLKNFPKLPNLIKLDLSSNDIAGTLHFLAGCTNLTHLDLSTNRIEKMNALKPLFKLKQLQSLNLTNCGVRKSAEYRKRVFKLCKALSVLDGENKTMADEEPIDEALLQEEKLEDPPRPKKRKNKSSGLSPSKRFKDADKNPLMLLNEIKPGLNYVVEEIGGPAHNPDFVVSVVIDEVKYEGHGNSKQNAKHAAAEAALKALAPSKFSASLPVMTDFTEDSMDTSNCNFEIQASNGSKLQPAKNVLKLLSEADKKNPVMLLNELHPGVIYQLTAENNDSPTQRFCMKVVVNGETYEGYGPNKKQAKASAARSVLAHAYSVSFNTVSANIPMEEDFAEFHSFPQLAADKIAKALYAKFADVMTGNAEFSKWKVIAGIAMTRDEALEDIQVVTLGTGTKCISGENISMVGANLNDCHAEVVSRRCLKEFLYTNLELHLEGERDQSIFMKRKEGGFQLKPGIKFHLYISTAPCGDARIFCPSEESVMEAVDRHPNRNSRGVLRTKIESGEGTIPIKSKLGVQTWDSILPGQERLLTMSCSDKIAMWNVVGVQGALLSYFIEPIYLDSIILGGLFHPTHLRRALVGRFEPSLGELPELFKLNKIKMCATTSPETRHLVKSPNFSVNWTSGLARAEVVNAEKGKTESGNISRISKRSFFQRFMNVCDRLSHVQRHEPPKIGLYSSYKNVAKDYKAAKMAAEKAFVSAGLGTWVKKPAEQNDFELVF